MKTLGSNLATRIGLAVLLALVLVCAYFGLSTLGVFLGGLLLLCLAAFLWARFSLRAIDVRFEGEDACAFPGETFSVAAELKNRKFLPLLWLDLAFPTAGNHAVAPLDETDEAVTETFTWLMPHQTLRWRQEAAAVQRGVCPVDVLHLRSGDGFGLAEQTADTRPVGAFRFVVYPRLIPVEIAPVLRNMRELEKARNGFTVDKTLLNSTRPYRDGDSFRDINWRLLARTDEVQVNVHETLAVRRVCFVPDAESYTYPVVVEHDGVKKTVPKLREEAMERTLSVIASLIVQLAERDVLCSLVLPAVGGRAARIIVPETAEEQVMQLLTVLAEFDYACEPTTLPLEELQEEHHHLGQIYLFSHNAATAFAAGDPALTEPLGIIRVLTEADEAAETDDHILKESDLITL